MHVSNLKLWNFRKYGSDGEFDLKTPDLSLDLNKNLNVLVGENDSGKTAIIDALKIIFKTHSFEWIRIENDDFFKDKDHLRIEAILSDLSSLEAKNFLEWLGWVGEGEEAVPYLRLILDVKRNPTTKEIKYNEVKAGVDEEGTALSGEAREFLKVTYLRPLRDAGSELVPKQNSRLSQILQGHQAFKNRGESHDLVKLFRKFNKDVQNYFLGIDADGTAITDLEGDRLKKEIDSYIQEFYTPDSESEFGVVQGTLKNILEKLELSLKEVKNPGLGTLNKLFISSELLHLKKDNWNGMKLGLIEEVEAHLHPQSQLQVMEALQAQNGIQLVLTTHSPNLASKIKIENLILCYKNKTFPLKSSETKLDIKQYKFLEKFLDVTKADLFFAKGLILVEGWSEEILIPSIAKKIGIDLTKKGVSVINIGNIGFQNYINIFLRQNEPYLDLPIAIVTDSDVRPYRKEETTEGLEFIDRYVPVDDATFRSETAAKVFTLSENDEQSVRHFVSENWTLEYSLANSVSFSELFKIVVKSVHTGTDWSNFNVKLAEKLLRKTLNKTEIAYKLASVLDSQHKNTTPISITEPGEADYAKYLTDAIKYASRV
ncbi:MAG TPA: AAA family ATPase [Candidatus Paceibacterota bacterium]|nr:AAA family ATPase [Candidatus Paceibacterota bacterium]HMO83017.1 AAA family ATPase [Candidatus Paceibacterota bacterium]